MGFESYVAGVGPEGVNEVYEVKILICYLLDNVKEPISGEELNEIFQNSSCVNYFALATALSELRKTGHIVTAEQNGNEGYVLEELGRETAHQLSSILPAALRDKVVNAALNLLAARKLNRERSAEIQKTEDGYIVHCLIHDIGTDLLDLRIFAPDASAAEAIRKQFLVETANVYKGLIGILTKNKKAIQDVVDECDI